MGLCVNRKQSVSQLRRYDLEGDSFFLLKDFKIFDSLMSSKRNIIEITKFTGHNFVR